MAVLSLVMGFCVSIFFFDMIDWSDSLVGFPPKRVMAGTALILLPIATGLVATVLLLSGRKPPWPELVMLVTIPLQVLALDLHASTFVLR